MIKVLFVCLGNICRSPLAEGIFAAKIKALGLEKIVKTDSAGTSDYHIGELPDERTLSCASKNGIIIQHRGRQVHRNDFKEFTYIIAMDHHNKRNLESLKLTSSEPDKEIHLMRNFSRTSLDLPVPDPYYGGEKDFDEVYRILDEAMEGFLSHILSKHSLIS